MRMVAAFWRIGVWAARQRDASLVGANLVQIALSVVCRSSREDVYLHILFSFVSLFLFPFLSVVMSIPHA
jgi:hypothetical protein